MKAEKVEESVLAPHKSQNILWWENIHSDCCLELSSSSPKVDVKGTLEIKTLALSVVTSNRKAAFYKLIEKVSTDAFYKVLM